MAGPYLIGIDCGTQSAKVVVYDARRRAVASGRRVLRPMERPRHGVVLHPDDDLWDAIGAASREAMAAFDGDPADIVGRGAVPVRCCKAFLRADGSLVEPVMSWMDERAYAPYLPDDPSLAYATTASGYLAHRSPAGSPTPPPTTSRSSGRSTPTPGTGATTRPLRAPRGAP
jgi:sugar (pentulose or hexulose) kinase